MFSSPCNAAHRCCAQFGFKPRTEWWKAQTNPLCNGCPNWSIVLSHVPWFFYLCQNYSNRYDRILLLLPPAIFRLIYQVLIVREAGSWNEALRRMLQNLAKCISVNSSKLNKGRLKKTTQKTLAPRKTDKEEFLPLQVSLSTWAFSCYVGFVISLYDFSS